MTELRWFHPPLSGGEEQGLNEAGIQDFKRPKALARETCQNIGDARPEGAAVPAVATFDRVDLPSAELPGRDQLRGIFEVCRAHVLKEIGSGTGNEKEFFDTAIELLSHDTLSTLRIGDENTLGLRGDDQERKLPFFRLLRGQGYSQMQGAGGGTYGIGQRAPFAHSALRTVLYGSRLADGSELFIAKNILASFPDPGNARLMTQSKGWWCEVVDAARGDWRTLRDSARIPRRFRRDTVGTDLWVTGFTNPDWERSVRHSVLEHFFAAIGGGQIVVRIAENGRQKVEIHAGNLEEQLAVAAAEARDDGNMDDYRKGLGATIYFDKALRQPLNDKPFARNIEHIGEVKLYVYRDPKNPDLPDLWAKMRAPRILVDHSGSTLLSRYAAVLLCDNPAGNRFLAEMEDSRHEKWDEDEARNWTQAQKKLGERVRKAIMKFVRDTLKEIRGADAGTAQDIPFLGRYLPAEDDPSADDDGAATTPTGATTENETGHRITKKVPVTSGKATRSKRAPSVDVATPGAEKKKQLGGGGKDRGGGGGEGGSGGGGTTGQAPGNRRGNIQPNKVRFRSFATENGYEIVLHSDDAVSGNIHLRSVGEDASRYDLAIQRVTDLATGQELACSGSIIEQVSLSAGETRRFKVSLTTDMKLCLTLGA